MAETGIVMSWYCSVENSKELTCIVKYGKVTEKRSPVWFGRGTVETGIVPLRNGKAMYCIVRAKLSKAMFGKGIVQLSLVKYW